MVTIDSDPPGAQVTMGHQSGFTPATFQVPRGRDYVVEVTHGNERRAVALRRSLEPLSLWNLIPPLWPGFIVDAMTGAISRYEPSHLTVRFHREAHLTRFGE